MAGYAVTSAGQRAYELLQRDDILRAINAEISKAERAAGVMSAEEVLEELSSLARGAEMDSDRLKALAHLAKYHGLLTDRLKVSYDEEAVNRRLDALLPSGGDE